MSAIQNLKTQWHEQKRLYIIAAAAITAVPIAVWGLSTLESATRCALRAFHTLISLDSKTRSVRWEKIKLQGWDTVANAALVLTSCVPIYGTYKSYEVIFEMASNHIFNKGKLHELQQKINTKQVDGLYQELLAWEPDIDKLVQLATQKEMPSQKELDETANQLRGSLIGRSVIYTTSYNLIDGSCTVVRICAIRIHRFALFLFKIRYLIHIIVKTIRIVFKAAALVIKATKQEAIFARDLVGQPRRISVSKKYPRELSHDDVFLILQACNTVEEREKARITLSKFSISRKAAIQNDLAASSSSFPPKVSHDFYHRVILLSQACGCRYATHADYILKEKYFENVFPFLENFDMNWLKKMPSQEKQKLIWELSTKVPNLRTLHLDMQDIDPRWQMLIAVKLAKHAPHLKQVTFAHADQKAVDIMRRFTGWLCKVSSL